MVHYAHPGNIRTLSATSENVARINLDVTSTMWKSVRVHMNGCHGRMNGLVGRLGVEFGSEQNYGLHGRIIILVIKMSLIDYIETRIPCCQGQWKLVMSPLYFTTTFISLLYYMSQPWSGSLYKYSTLLPISIQKMWPMGSPAIWISYWLHFSIWLYTKKPAE